MSAIPWGNGLMATGLDPGGLLMETEEGISEMQSTITSGGRGRQRKKSKMIPN